MFRFIPFISLAIIGIIAFLIIEFKKKRNILNNNNNAQPIYSTGNIINENGIFLKSVILNTKNHIGDKFNFLAKKADVVSEPQIWTETHIHSSGGGGYVHPEHGSHVSAPTIHSNVIERERYFVKFNDGS